PILPPPPQIPCPVHPPSNTLRILYIGLRHEPLRRHPFLFYIPLPHPRSSYTDLPHYSHSHRLQLLIHDVHSRVPDRPPNRYALPSPLHSRDFLRHRKRRRLRRPISIHQMLRLPSPLHHPPHHSHIQSISSHDHIPHPPKLLLQPLRILVEQPH